MRVARGNAKHLQYNCVNTYIREVLLKKKETVKKLLLAYQKLLSTSSGPGVGGIISFSLKPRCACTVSTLSPGGAPTRES